MWTVSISRKENDILDVSATYTDANTNFTWAATIKKTEISTFVARAKKELVAYQLLHKDDDAIKMSIQMELSK